LAAIFFAAVRAVSHGDYTQAQIEAWAPEPPHPETFRERAADGRLLLVAVDKTDRPLAYGDLQPDGHLDHLYRHPDASRMGIAAQVYAGLEDAAQEQGLTRLFVEASEPAKRFFLRRGFTLIERRKFDLRGTPIHNYTMERRL
jgi:putative acetyltransferase